MPERFAKPSWFSQLFPVFGCKHYQGLVTSQRGPRPENQDNYLLIKSGGEAHYLLDEQPQSRTIKGWGKHWWRLLVADGMGGHRDGRQISEALVQQALNVRPQYDPIHLREQVFKLHAALQQQFRKEGDRHNPGSTLLWVDVHVSGLATIAHVGDSRLFHWSATDEEWQQLTHDHTQQEFDWRSADTAYVMGQEPTGKQHGLAQAVGYGSFGLLTNADGHRPLEFSTALRLDLVAELPPHASDHADVFSLQLQKGDALLLASDGLWSAPEQVGEPQLPPPQELVSATALDKLVWDILAADGRDNTTVVMLNTF